MTTSIVREALRRAIEYLLAARSPGHSGGLPWTDFDLHAGESDEWVSAYIACALLKTGEEDARSAAAETWLALEQRSTGREPGFGYNRSTTRDGDSTAWACRLAAELGIRAPTFSLAIQFLGTCRHVGGGVSTYPGAGAVRRAIHIPDHVSVAGWAHPHVCVSAATAGIKGLPWAADVCRFLMTMQADDGGWHGYWWCDREYATALAIESLRPLQDAAAQQAVTRAAGYLGADTRVHSPFRTALRAIGTGNQQAVSALLELQQPDGGWAASARLRIPFPYERDPDSRWDWTCDERGFGSIRLDHRRTFTTATAVWALSNALRQ